MVFFAYAAPQDKQIRRKQSLHSAQKFVNPLGPFFPIQILFFAHPVRSPIFRITAELNKLRSGFVTPDVVRSRRFRVGPETF